MEKFQNKFKLKFDQLYCNNELQESDVLLVSKIFLGI